MYWKVSIFQWIVSVLTLHNYASEHIYMVFFYHFNVIGLSFTFIFLSKGFEELSLIKPAPLILTSCRTTPSFLRRTSRLRKTLQINSQFYLFSQRISFTQVKCEKNIDSIISIWRRFLRKQWHTCNF